MTSVLEAQTRIADIQTRIAALSGKSPAGGTAFADTLNNVLGTTSHAPVSSTPTATGQDVVDIAKEWLGVPYVWGGNDPSKGLDCSALVQQAYKRLGIELPRLADAQAKAGTAVGSLKDAKPGDLIAFGSPVDHIGIYAGDNKMVVAPRRGDVVKVQEIYKEPSAIRRILPDSPSVAAFGSASMPTSAAPGAISSGLRSQYDSLFLNAGAKYNISPNLLAAVAKQESGFNANARSHAGAQGLMQIMPGTARGLGVNALDPKQAVDGAAKMLSGLVSKFGSVELALAGYNAGPGAVQKYGGIPPYKETQNYVKNVISLSKGAR